MNEVYVCLLGVSVCFLVCYAAGGVVPTWSADLLVSCFVSTQVFVVTFSECLRLGTMLTCCSAGKIVLQRKSRGAPISLLRRH